MSDFLDSETPALKPCPFCGADAQFATTDADQEYIECVNLQCNVATRLMTPEKCDVSRLLAESWNERIERPAIARVVKAAQDWRECQGWEFEVEISDAVDALAKESRR